MKKIISFIKRFVFSFFLVLVQVRLGHAEDSCPTLSQYSSDGIGDNFILRSPYEYVAEACSDIANLSWDVFSKPLMGVVAVGFSIYIAVYTLKNIASFSQQDFAAYLSNEKTGLIPLGFKAGIIVWLLGNNDFIYSHLIGPVITSGMELGLMLGQTDTLTMSSFEDTTNVRQLFQQIINTAIYFNDMIYPIVARGRLMLCLAFLPDSIIDWHFSLIPYGLILLVFGWFIIIGMAFYMIDVLLRFGIGCIMLPFAIACSMSKLTSNYAKKTWILFINTTFNFIILGVVITISVKMLGSAIGGGKGDPFTNPSKVFSNSDAEELVKNLSMTMLTLTAITSQIVFKLFNDVGSIVESLIGGGNVGKVGANVGTEFIGKARKATAKPLKEAWNLGKATAKESKESLKNTKIGQTVSNKGSQWAYAFKSKILGLK